MGNQTKHPKQKSSMQPLVIALGTGLAMSVANTAIANPNLTNPFAAHKLNHGYMLATDTSNHTMKSQEGRCGVAKDQMLKKNGGYSDNGEALAKDNGSDNQANE